MKKSKILVSTALALCMGATAVTPAFAANSENFTYTKIGDYNADGVVNVADVTALQLQLGGKDVITGAMLDCLDFNGDGSFNVNDVSEIQKMIVGADYECFMQPSEDYKNIKWESRDELIPEENKIDFELLYRDSALIFTNYSAKTKYEYYLIKSKEEFYSIFGVYSPNFGDEYFKDNALYIELHYDPYYDNEYKVLSMGVENNKLCIDEYFYFPLIQSPMPACWHMFYKIKKSDIENIDTVSRNVDSEIGDPIY